MIDKKKLFEEFEKDSALDEFKLADAAMAIPQLHSKYTVYLDLARNELSQVEFLYHQTLKQRISWYDGKMSKAEMDQLNWPYDPFDGILVKTKTAKESYYKVDPVIHEAKLKLDERKNIVKYIEDYLDNLRWRTQTIKTALDAIKFAAGF